MGKKKEQMTDVQLDKLRILRRRSVKGKRTSNPKLALVRSSVYIPKLIPSRFALPHVNQCKEEREYLSTNKVRFHLNKSEVEVTVDEKSGTLKISAVGPHGLSIKPRTANVIEVHCED